jgi:predicted DNA-binding transcriptional regulator AlpA
MEYQFNLKFKCASEYADENYIMMRLGETECTDALVGLGLPGYVGLEFIREAQSAEEAFLSALEDVKKALPKAILVEASPDFVGLTDIADLLGMSRQNMRKIFISHTETFPPPVHGGNSTVWHLSQVLQFLATCQYEFDQKVYDVAKAAMQVNLTKEKILLDPKFYGRFRQRLQA